MTKELNNPSYVEAVVEWTLAREVDDSRKAVIRQARLLVERLTKLANGLEADPDFTFNTIGVLQGNGVELDTMCARLGMARNTLQALRQAMVADANLKSDPPKGATP